MFISRALSDADFSSRPVKQRSKMWVMRRESLRFSSSLVGSLLYISLLSSKIYGLRRQLSYPSCFDGGVVAIPKD